MARLPTSGATSMSPFKKQADFSRALSDLGFNVALHEGAARELYLELAAIVGRWDAEQRRFKVKPIAKAISLMGKHLDAIADTLEAVETGFHSGTDIEIAGQLARYLALDPTVGSIDNAKDLIASF